MLDFFKRQEKSSRLSKKHAEIAKNSHIQIVLKLYCRIQIHIYIYIYIGTKMISILQGRKIKLSS